MVLHRQIPQGKQGISQTFKSPGQIDIFPDGGQNVILIKSIDGLYVLPVKRHIATLELVHSPELGYKEQWAVRVDVKGFLIKFDSIIAHGALLPFHFSFKGRQLVYSFLKQRCEGGTQL